MPRDSAGQPLDPFTYQGHELYWAVPTLAQGFPTIGTPFPKQNRWIYCSCNANQYSMTNVLFSTYYFAIIGHGSFMSLSLCHRDKIDTRMRNQLNHKKITTAKVKQLHWG